MAVKLMKNMAAPGADDEIYGVKRHCRACFDFKTWMKKSGKVQDAPVVDPPKKDGKECPADKDELGRNTWSFLHTMSVHYPEQPTEQEKNDMTSFIHLFSKFYPCPPCAEDLRKDIKIHPPKTESRKELSLWFCNIHNIVNKKLGKPEFNCNLVDQRWLDGWEDGSCG